MPNEGEGAGVGERETDGEKPPSGPNASKYI